MSNRINRVTVSEHNDDYTRHSEGDVVELRDGRLLLAYMEFSGDGSDEASTRLVARVSDDGGITWSGHRVLTETEPGDRNVYSPNLLRRPDGDILFLFMRQHDFEPRRTTQYVWRSTDEGVSFSPMTEFEKNGSHSLCNAVVTSLRSGRILLPLVSVGASGAYEATVSYSDDGGETWCRSASDVALPMRGVMEPHVAEIRDGRVLMVMRTQLGAVFMSESADAGETWSKPQTTGLRAPESCPALTTIPDTDDLLMVWNNSPYDPAFGSHYGKRSPLTVAVSEDEGRTWAYVKDIEDDPARAFSNPGCRFTREGRAIINYWTCEYLPGWRMQDVIDLRVAVVDTAWFYEAT